MTTQNVLDLAQGPVSPEELERLLFASFPADAEDWGQATDEVRDLCRAARELADVPESEAVNFRALTTPSQWNSKGVAGTVAFYGRLTDERRHEFCARFGHWMGFDEVKTVNS